MNKAYQLFFWTTALVLVFAITLNSYLWFALNIQGFPPIAAPSVVVTLDVITLAVLVFLYKRGHNG